MVVQSRGVFPQTALSQLDRDITEGNLFKFISPINDINYFYFKQILTDLVDSKLIETYTKDEEEENPQAIYKITTEGKASLDLTIERGSAPSKEEIAKKIGISVQKLSQLIEAAQGTVSIESPTNQKDENAKLADFIVDESSSSPDTKVTQDSLLCDIRKMLNQLSPKERDVLILRYGLDDNGEKKTLEEIGSRYGVSRERIRQIENRAMSKLKKLCKNANININLKNYI